MWKRPARHRVFPVVAFLERVRKSLVQRKKKTKKTKLKQISENSLEQKRKEKNKQDPLQPQNRKPNKMQKNRHFVRARYFRLEPSKSS